MSLSRSAFMVTVPAVGAAVALVLLPGSPQSPGGSESDAEGRAGAPRQPDAPIVQNAPVVSFHLDRPYLDLTGLEKPYVPPVGMRSGAPLAALSEEEILSRFYGFI